MRIQLPKTFTATSLGLLYVLAFVISPYWLLAQSLSIKILILTITICLGVFWSYYSADSFQLQIDFQKTLLFSIFLLGLIILNYLPLTSVIPWRGDENVHITRVLILISRIKILWIIIVLLLFSIILYAAWHRPAWVPVAMTLTVMGVILFFANDNPFQGERLGWILRYPLLNYWFFMFVPKLAGSISSPYDEILYRIIPLICMVTVVWYFQKGIPFKSNISKILWGFSIATMPIVYYYSSILYIEPMAIFLMLVVCLQAKNLLYENYDKIKKNPAWYALILIGFIKETVIIFLFCYLVCRLSIQFVKGRSEKSIQKENGNETFEKKKPTKSFIAGEIKIFLSVTLPYLFYLILRNTLSTNRNYVPGIQGILNISVYRAVGQSFLEQFGPFLILFCIGCILLFMRKEYAILYYLLTTLLAFPLFYVIDHKGVYAGYSRFNLFILPAILAGTLFTLKNFYKQKQIVGMVMPCIIISINLLTSPINLDGTKKPFWGSYLIDTSEHYYPYRDALSWVHDNYGNERVISAGLNYPYFFEFYFDKLDWHPRNKVEKYFITGNVDDEHDMYFDNMSWRPNRRIDQLLASGAIQSESETLSRSIDIATESNYRIVLYHVLGENIPQLDENSQFRQVKIITNDAHTLVIYAMIR